MVEGRFANQGARMINNVWFARQGQILLAVMLQDMKTRFGASYLSYLVAIAWPLSHVCAILVAYLIVNNFAPIGDDPVVFVFTAAIPYMLCLYPARLIAMAVPVNKPFLNYNYVTPGHLILARTLLEFFNVSIVVILILFGCFLFDANVFPLSVGSAAAALAASLFLGIAFGLLSAVLTAVIGPFFIVIIVMIMILLYIAALPLAPDYLISSYSREFLSYNPIFVLISWFRASYFTYYEFGDFSRFYVVALSFALFFLGVLGERLLRGKIIGH